MTRAPAAARQRAALRDEINDHNYRYYVLDSPSHFRARSTTSCCASCKASNKSTPT